MSGNSKCEAAAADEMGILLLYFSLLANLFCQLVVWEHDIRVVSSVGRNWRVEKIFDSICSSDGCFPGRQISCKFSPYWRRHIHMSARPCLVHTFRKVFFQMFRFHCLQRASHRHFLEVEDELVISRRGGLVHCKCDEYGLHVFSRITDVVV